MRSVINPYNPRIREQSLPTSAGRREKVTILNNYTKKNPYKTQYQPPPNDPVKK